MGRFTICIRESFDGYKDLFYPCKPSKDELNDLSHWDFKLCIGLLKKGLRIYYWDEFSRDYLHIETINSPEFVLSHNEPLFSLLESKRAHGLLPRL